MKKRIFAIVLACLTVLTVLPLSAWAIGSDTTEHVHAYTEEIVTPATCTQMGAKELTCEECGYSVTVVIPALGHNFEESDTKDSTCTELGVKTFTCTLCGESYTEQLPATGHHYVKEVKDPTCTENGAEIYTCEDCDDSYTVVIPATGHHYTKKEVIDPTCSTEGKNVYTCEDCDASYETAVKPPLQHSYSYTINAATCTEDGSIVYTCNLCGETHTDKLPARGHNYVVTETHDATCTGKGVKIYTCTYCHDTYFVQSPSNGHNYDNGVVLYEATCIEDGIMIYTCTDCGKTHQTSIPATGKHIYEETAYTSEDGKYTYHPCTMCDDILVTQGWGEMPTANGISKRIKANVSLFATVNEKILLTVTVNATDADLASYTDLELNVNGTAYALSASDFVNGVCIKEIEFGVVNITKTFTATFSGVRSGVKCTAATASLTFGRVMEHVDDSAKKEALENATAKFLAEGLTVNEVVSLVYHIDASTVNETDSIVIRNADGTVAYTKTFAELSDSLTDGKYVVRMTVSANEWKQVFAATICNAEGTAISNTYYYSVSAFAARHITAKDLDELFTDILCSMMKVVEE